MHNLIVWRFEAQSDVQVCFQLSTFSLIAKLWVLPLLPLVALLNIWPVNCSAASQSLLSIGSITDRGGLAAIELCHVKSLHFYIWTTFFFVHSKKEKKLIKKEKKLAKSKSVEEQRQLWADLHCRLPLASHWLTDSLTDSLNND